MSKKMIEKVAMAIWEEAGNIYPDEAMPLAKAAIEALDIAILPKDAVPQKGDIVSVYDDEDRKIVGKLGQAHQFFGEKILFADEYSNLKVIQRNGKPVVYDEWPILTPQPTPNLPNKT